MAHGHFTTFMESRGRLKDRLALLVSSPSHTRLGSTSGVSRMWVCGFVCFFAVDQTQTRRCEVSPQPSAPLSGSTTTVSHPAPPDPVAPSAVPTSTSRGRRRPAGKGPLPSRQNKNRKLKAIFEFEASFKLCKTAQKMYNFKMIPN